MAKRKDPFEGDFTPGDVASLGKDDKKAVPEAPKEEPKAEKKPSKPKTAKPKLSEIQKPIDKIVINPELPGRMNEEVKRKSDTVVVLNGRMNPVTKGHEENVQGMHKIADQHKADHLLIATHSHDQKTVGSDNKNPLSPEQKLKHLRRAFPDTNIDMTSKDKPSILHKLSELHSKGYKHVILAAGGDRVEDQSYDMVHKYNGSLADAKGNPHRHGYYNFDSIKVESTGERKKGVSGTDMRKYAESGDSKKFNANLPSALRSNPEHAQELLNDVRGGMKIESDKKNKAALQEKAYKHGIKLSVLREVFARGVDSWTEERKSTPEQYAFARVNSFISLGESYKTLDADLRDINETIDLQGRLKRKVKMAMFRKKIERARKIAMSRFAKNKNLRNRALKLARGTLRKRLGGARGKSYGKLSTQQKIAVDKLLDGKRKQIKNIANKIINRVKRDEAGRLSGSKSSTAKTAIVAHTELKTMSMISEQNKKAGAQ